MDEQQLEAIEKEFAGMLEALRKKVLHRFTGELEITVHFNQGGIRTWYKNEKEKMK